MALGHGPNITSNDLILNYDFSNIRSYAGSGLTIQNIVQSAYGATLVNGPTFTTNYLTFDGSNDYLQTSLPLLTVYTVVMWIYVVSYDNTERQILGTTGDVVGLSLVSGKFNIWNGSTNLSNTAFSLGTWYHLAYTRTGSSTKIYLNGSIDGTFVSGANISAGAATIGQIARLRFLNARINNFAIYTSELTASQIKSIYNATKGRFGL